MNNKTDKKIKDAKSNQKNKLYNHRKYKAHIIN